MKQGKIHKETEMNKRLAQRCLKGFYWLLAISAYAGLTMGLPYSMRQELLLEGCVWWHFALKVFFGIPLVGATLFLFAKLHQWAFDTKEEKRDRKSVV